MGSVAGSLRKGGGSRLSDQGAVWGAVASKGREFGAHSNTSSMTDFYESRRPSLDEFVRNFEWVAGQVGVCAVVKGKVIALEMFEEPGIMRQFFPKLMLSYAAEVVAKPIRASIVLEPKKIRSLLKRIGEAKCERYDAVGEGEEYRFKVGSLQGTALSVGDRLIHLVALRKSRRGRFWQ